MNNRPISESVKCSKNNRPIRCKMYYEQSTNQQKLAEDPVETNEQSKISVFFILYLIKASRHTVRTRFLQSIQNIYIQVRSLNAEQSLIQRALALKTKALSYSYSCKYDLLKQFPATVSFSCTKYIFASVCEMFTFYWRIQQSIQHAIGSRNRVLSVIVM